MSKKKIAFLSLSVVLMLTLLGGAVFGQTAQKNNIYRYLSIFSEVYDLVKSNYVDQTQADQLMDGAFSGVTDAVDEFSYYVPPAQMTAYKTFDGEEDNGIGLVVSKRFGYAYVLSAVPGSPAAKAGIERGDFIEKVDGKNAQKMAIWEVRNALRANKAVKLHVIRGGQTKREDFTLQRTDFHPMALTNETVRGIAVIKIPYFEKDTAAQFKTALEQIRKSGNRKLIVDLRGNAGGDVEQAIAAADELLTSGLITSIEGRKVEQRRWQADRDTAYDGDLEVLTDNSTAAGAEVFAAAIHGNQRGKLVGIPTYGKAIVQQFIGLPSGGGVQMTIGHYTTPDLKPIKEQGVRPDVIVDLSAAAIPEPGSKDAAKKQPDLIMEKALSLFTEQQAAKSAA
ncbi:MAG: PDZ domain-containing protein [Acidobacteria bacterium]|nr:PDZ domain-containing protein [Acidobacteriota bacterium]